MPASAEAKWGSPSGLAAEPESQPRQRQGSVIIRHLQLWADSSLSVVRYREVAGNRSAPDAIAEVCRLDIGTAEAAALTLPALPPSGQGRLSAVGLPTGLKLCG